MASNLYSQLQGWSEYDMQAKFDLTHHPRLVEQEARNRRPQRKGVLATLLFCIRVLGIGLYAALMLGFLRGAFGL